MINGIELTMTQHVLCCLDKLEFGGCNEGMKAIGCIGCLRLMCWMSMDLEYLDVMDYGNEGNITRI